MFCELILLAATPIKAGSFLMMDRELERGVLRWSSVWPFGSCRPVGVLRWEDCSCSPNTLEGERYDMDDNALPCPADVDSLTILSRSRSMSLTGKVLVLGLGLWVPPRRFRRSPLLCVPARLAGLSLMLSAVMRRIALTSDHQSCEPISRSRREAEVCGRNEALVRFLDGSDTVGESCVNTAVTKTVSDYGNSAILVANSPSALLGYRTNPFCPLLASA